MLRALFQGDAALWPKQRSVIGPKSVAKVISLEFPDALALFLRTKPQASPNPILAMSDELNLTHLKDIGASLFAALAEPIGHPLSASDVRQQIAEALVGTAANSEAHTLGLVLLALCKLAEHRTLNVDEPVISAIAGALAQGGARSKSGELLLQHFGAGGPSLAKQHEVLLSAPAARDLDILLEICLRLLLLKQGGRNYGPATLQIRQLLTTTGFRRICQDVRSLARMSDQSPESSEVSEAESVDDRTLQCVSGPGLSECTFNLMERLAAPIRLVT